MAKAKVAPSKTITEYTRRGNVKAEPLGWLQLVPLIVSMLCIVYVAFVGLEGYVWQYVVPEYPVVIGLDRPFQELFPRGTGMKPLSALLNPTPVRDTRQERVLAEAKRIFEANQTLQEAFAAAENMAGSSEGGGTNDTMKRINDRLTSMAKMREAAEQLKEVDDHLAEKDMAAQQTEHQKRQTEQQTEKRRFRASQAFREADEAPNPEQPIAYSSLPA